MDAANAAVHSNELYAPFDTLSNEIIAYILIIAAQTTAPVLTLLAADSFVISDQLPIVAMHVSKLWKAVTESTPAMWTAIPLVGDVKDWQRTITTYCKYSGTLPLHIHIRFPNAEIDYPMLVAARDVSFHRAMKSLNVTLPMTMILPMSDMLRFVQGRRSWAGWFGVEELGLTGTEEGAIPVDDIGSLGYGTNLAQALSPYQRLRRLTIRDITFDPPIGESEGHLHTAELPVLEELRLEGVNRLALDLLVTLSMPSLQTLGIKCQPRHATLQDGVGSRLTAYCRKYSERMVMQSIRNIALYNVDPMENVHSILSLAPNVVRLASCPQYADTTSNLFRCLQVGLWRCRKLQSWTFLGPVPWSTAVIKSILDKRSGTLRQLVLSDCARDHCLDWPKSDKNLILLPDNDLRFEPVLERMIADS